MGYASCYEDILDRRNSDTHETRTERVRNGNIWIRTREYDEIVKHNEGLIETNRRLADEVQIAPQGK